VGGRQADGRAVAAPSAVREAAKLLQHTIDLPSVVSCVWLVAHWLRTLTDMSITVELLDSGVSVSWQLCIELPLALLTVLIDGSHCWQSITQAASNHSLLSRILHKLTSVWLQLNSI
jgi:hypothetical protein